MRGVQNVGMLSANIKVVINPRRACAARVTVVVLRESWGAFFSMKGGKGEERGGKGKRVKVQIKEGNSNFIFIQK